MKNDCWMEGIPQQELRLMLDTTRGMDARGFMPDKCLDLYYVRAHFYPMWENVTRSI